MLLSTLIRKKKWQRYQTESWNLYFIRGWAQLINQLWNRASHHQGEYPSEIGNSNTCDIFSSVWKCVYISNLALNKIIATTHSISLFSPHTRSLLAKVQGVNKSICKAFGHDSTIISMKNKSQSAEPSCPTLIMPWRELQWDNNSIYQSIYEMTNDSFAN